MEKMIVGKIKNDKIYVKISLFFIMKITKSKNLSSLSDTQLENILQRVVQTILQIFLLWTRKAIVKIFTNR